MMMIMICFFASLGRASARCNVRTDLARVVHVQANRCTTQRNRGTGQNRRVDFSSRRDNLVGRREPTTWHVVAGERPTRYVRDRRRDSHKVALTQLWHPPPSSHSYSFDVRHLPTRKRSERENALKNKTPFFDEYIFRCTTLACVKNS